MLTDIFRFCLQTCLGIVLHGRVLHVALLGLRLHAPNVPSCQPNNRSSLIKAMKKGRIKMRMRKHFWILA